MFEILKAIMALQEACRGEHHSMTWDVRHPETDAAPTLVVEIPIWAADVEFINDMRAMFAPIDS